MELICEQYVVARRTAHVALKEVPRPVLAKVLDLINEMLMSIHFFMTESSTIYILHRFDPECSVVKNKVNLEGVMPLRTSCTSKLITGADTMVIHSR